MNRKAFTLIELLVVVLIIGILSAIALPQYERAVAKSRISSGMPLGRALMTALDEYYLANSGAFTAVYDNLVVQLPGGYTDKNGNAAESVKSGDSLYYNVGTGNEKKYQLQSGGVVQYQAKLPNGKSVNIYFYSNYATADEGAFKGRIFCTGENNAAIATKYCQLLGGTKEVAGKYFIN